MAGDDHDDGEPPRRGVPGSLIDGRYRLESLVGAGGFGEVWRATHLVDGSDVRTVAIKLLDPPGAGGDAGWLDEVRAVRDVACDAISTIFDVGVARDGTAAFIAMELLEGETLDARLEHGPVPWRRALAIGREVARALAACHRVGVVHCDLKPQNVFLCGSGRVCVLDFGIAALGGRAASPQPGRAGAGADPVGDTRPLGAVAAGDTRGGRARQPRSRAGRARRHRRGAGGPDAVGVDVGPGARRGRDRHAGLPAARGLRRRGPDPAAAARSRSASCCTG
ncbi:MAG: serine/threonine protein kinase [Kofleriaceae bacterium]|nr:serine/threonine protein kinase [Kofleriaceae bacterium]